MIAQLREKNTGLCRKTLKAFRELIAHFIVDLDEMCLMSDAFGDLHVIGAESFKNHEAMIDYRYAFVFVQYIFLLFIYIF